MGAASDADRRPRAPRLRPLLQGWPPTAASGGLLDMQSPALWYISYAPIKLLKKPQICQSLHFRESSR